MTTRREFLRLGAVAGSTLIVALHWPLRRDVRATGAPTELSAYIAVAGDGTVTLYAPVPEIGQGVRTALPMILADELRVDWSQVRIEQAPADPRFGPMAVGGSDSVSDYWIPLRTAGAAARAKLVQAASARWGVPTEECRADRGTVIHTMSGRTLDYGELAKDASRFAAPESPSLLDPSSFTLIGKPIPRVDSDDIVQGRAVYGIDVRRPDMRNAVIRRPPVHGARLRRFDATAASNVDGVERVFEIKPLVPGGYRYGSVRGGVVVVARDTWAALRGRDALVVEWDDGEYSNETSESIRARLRAGSSTPLVVRDQGNVEEAFQSAAKIVEAEYELPPLAHACMEPMNFTSHVGDGRCDLWGPTQQPLQAQELVAAVLQLPQESVHLHPTLEGGGFGRRLSIDYVLEAVLVAREIGAPVKVLWTQEDDLHHDFFRTPSHHRLRAAIARSGEVAGWTHQLATASLSENISGPGRGHPGVYDLEGAANLPYDISNIRVEYSPIDIGLQMGSWRSVSHSFNVFAVNAFIDEIATVMGVDPLELHLSLLGEPRAVSIELPLPGRRGQPHWDTGRLRRVLRAAADEAGWGRGLPPGWGRGIACCYFKRTYVAHVAEVSVEDGGRVRVRRVVAAIDCGRPVNPDGVKAQVEGAAIDGVATVLHWGITVENGRVQESSLGDYPLVRMNDAPVIETHIVASDEEPSGAGEPPYPSVAPAICNAIFAASGRRVRSLPLRST